jgi:hypothetical protein
MADQDNGSKAGSPGTPAAASSPSARRVAAKSRPRKAAVKSSPRKAAAKSRPRKAAAKSPPRKAAASPTPATKVVVPDPVLPDNGPAAGGTTVKIYGRNLVGVRSVTFGGDYALYFQEINAGLLQATSPPGAAGETVDIVVETRIPPSYTPGAFTYT